MNALVFHEAGQLLIGDIVNAQCKSLVQLTHQFLGPKQVPDDAADDVVDRELSVRHAAYSGNEWGERADDRDEAAENDRLAPVLREEGVPLDEAMADPMNARVPPRVSPEFIHQVEKWALVHGVPVDDRPPPILEEIEKLNPIPGGSAAEIRARQYASIAQHLPGSKPAPFPVAAIQC